MKKATGPQEVLDRDILEQLLLASAPLAPAPDRAAALKQRVLSRAREERAAAAGDFVTVRSAAGGWIDYTPQIKVKLLHVDGRYNSVLVRLAPGATLPEHLHDADEECIVLEGEVYHGDIRVEAGDYHLARKGSRHGVMRSATGALLFVRTTMTVEARAAG